MSENVLDLRTFSGLCYAKCGNGYRKLCMPFLKIILPMFTKWSREHIGFDGLPGALSSAFRLGV